MISACLCQTRVQGHSPKDPAVDALHRPRGLLAGPHQDKAPEQEVRWDLWSARLPLGAAGKGPCGDTCLRLAHESKMARTLQAILSRQKPGVPTERRRMKGMRSTDQACETWPYGEKRPTSSSFETSGATEGIGTSAVARITG